MKAQLLSLVFLTPLLQAQQAGPFPRPSTFIAEKVGRDPFGATQPGKIINRSLRLLNPRELALDTGAKPKLADFFNVSTISIGRYRIAVINRFAFAVGEHFQFNHPDTGVLLIKVAEIADGLVLIECEGQLHKLPISRREPKTLLRRKSG